MSGEGGSGRHPGRGPEALLRRKGPGLVFGMIQKQRNGDAGG